MSALIKASVASAELQCVGSFGSRYAAEQSPAAVREAILEDRIAALEAEIAKTRASLPKQLERARLDSAREALKERSDSEEKALQHLRGAIAEAKSGWSDRLNSLDTLSLGLASEVLEQVFADADRHAVQVASCIKRRLEILEARSVLRARVSAKDFPNAERLEALAVELGELVELVADTKLEAGACVLDLKLGHLEIGAGVQWQRISELLDRLEREATEA